MPSLIYNLNGNDKTLILDTRNPLTQPFAAGNWTDLRLTLACSLTKQSDPNDPTGLAETIGAGEEKSQFYWGFKSSDQLFPDDTNFFGISTRATAFPASATILSAVGVGPDYYDPNNVGDGFLHSLISNGTTKTNGTTNGIIHFQNKIAAPTFAGITTFIILKMLRFDPTKTQVDSCLALVTGNSFDNGTPFDTDSTTAHLRSVTANAVFTQQFSPFTFSSVPDSVFCYWPFMNSRLRIHNYVLEKYA